MNHYQIKKQAFQRFGTGFTLIELLVVISIIGLMSSVLLISVSNARKKGRDAKRVSDMRALGAALESIYNEAYAYPTGTTGATYANNNQPLGRYKMTAYSLGKATSFTPTFVTMVPSAPTPQDGTCTQTQNAYYYQTDAGGTTYTLSFCLGGNLDTLKAGVRYMTPGGFR